MIEETQVNESVIEEFQKIFDKYFNAFNQYLYGAFSDNHEYKFSHPELFELANELQYQFYILPILFENVY